MIADQGLHTDHWLGSYILYHGLNMADKDKQAGAELCQAQSRFS